MSRLLFALLLLALLALGVFLAVPSLAARHYGTPSPHLSPWQTFEYSARLLWHDGLLTRPANLTGVRRIFYVEEGETVASIAGRLEADGLILSAAAFRDYLVYSGLDTSIQAGEHSLSPSMTVVDIAHALQDATPTRVTFVILAGWRLEEIAASLPTSGLSISPDEFLAAAHSPPPGLDFLVGASSVEGFLFPDSYDLPRQLSAGQLVNEFVRRFAQNLTPELRQGFARQGLSVYEAVTLASIVEREAVIAEEQPLIASVFLNRLEAGMNLESDPTVQYALGYDASTGTWWKNPLTLEDLEIDSPYNTYRHPGLPPTPIGNPSLSALRAVAFPAQTPYFYFRAACDGSGRHLFAETFEEHLSNACP
ncbi:MAG: endolytic transglycosylase MltG [Anaerolineae bacterium]|nr:MAG: endolytic transglycosylase MltG [Anaerolineae bacterium]